MPTSAQALHYEGPPRTVHLDKGTYMWVHLARFTIDPEADDAELVNALVAHRAFRVSFWDGDELGEEQITPDSIHGPYPLSRIHPRLFKLVDAVSAEAELFAWANDQEWNPPYAGQSAETMERLRAEVCVLFRRGNVYQLIGLTEDDYVESTPVAWMGFVEFIVIDRDTAELHLVVAADD